MEVRMSTPEALLTEAKRLTGIDDPAEALRKIMLLGFTIYQIITAPQGKVMVMEGESIRELTVGRTATLQ